MLTNLIAKITSNAKTPLIINEIFTSRDRSFKCLDWIELMQDFMSSKQDLHGSYMISSCKFIPKDLRIPIRQYLSDEMNSTAVALNTRLLVSILNDYEDNYLIGFYFRPENRFPITSSIIMPTKETQLKALNSGLILLDNYVHTHTRL